VKQTQNAPCVAGYEILGDDTDESAHGIRPEAGEDEFDQDYDDDEADKSKNGGTHANRKDMASWQRLTKISYSKRKEGD
jgi:hypothetical protein